MACANDIRSPVDSAARSRAAVIRSRQTARASSSRACQYGSARNVVAGADDGRRRSAARARVRRRNRRRPAPAPALPGRRTGPSGARTPPPGFPGTGRRPPESSCAPTRSRPRCAAPGSACAAVRSTASASAPRAPAALPGPRSRAAATSSRRSSAGWRRASLSSGSRSSTAASSNSCQASAGSPVWASAEASTSSARAVVPGRQASARSMARDSSANRRVTCQPPRTRWCIAASAVRALRYACGIGWDSAWCSSSVGAPRGPRGVEVQAVATIARACRGQSPVSAVLATASSSRPTLRSRRSTTVRRREERRDLRLHDRTHPLDHTVGHKRDISVRDSALVAVETDRLELAERRVATDPVDDQQRLLFEAGQQLQGVGNAADRARHPEVERHAQHREPARGGLLLLGQQVVAPADRGPQRAVPVVGGARPAGQQREAVAETGKDVGGGQHGDAARGQFDGQRHAVERSAHGDDVGDVGRVHLERTVHRDRTVAEEHHRVVTQSLGDVGVRTAAAPARRPRRPVRPQGEEAPVTSPGHAAAGSRPAAPTRRRATSSSRCSQLSSTSNGRRCCSISAITASRTERFGNGCAPTAW